jgi:hypothetical protein
MRSPIVIATVVLAIVFAPSALAAGNGPTKSVYDQKGKQVQSTVAVVGTQANKPPTTPPPAATPAVESTTVSQGTLPFTGLDLGFLAAAGVLLLGMGVSLRRITRKTEKSI